MCVCVWMWKKRMISIRYTICKLKPALWYKPAHGRLNGTTRSSVYYTLPLNLRGQHSKSDSPHLLQLATELEFRHKHSNQSVFQCHDLTECFRQACTIVAKHCVPKVSSQSTHCNTQEQDGYLKSDYQSIWPWWKPESLQLQEHIAKGISYITGEA